MSKNDSLADFEKFMGKKSSAYLGGLLREYLIESNHGGWEGYSARDKTGIRKLLVDMMVYANHADTDFEVGGCPYQYGDPPCDCKATGRPCLRTVNCHGN